MHGSCHHVKSTQDKETEPEICENGVAEGKEKSLFKSCLTQGRAEVTSCPWRTLETPRCWSSLTALLPAPCSSSTMLVLSGCRTGTGVAPRRGTKAEGQVTNLSALSKGVFQRWQ